jgi:alcohol dehydrogenase
MKALVFYGPGKRAWEDVRDPVVNDPEDVVVQVDAFTICGTALHILRWTPTRPRCCRPVGSTSAGW